MATIIGLTKDEKLAMLKLMIEISNHYSSKLINSSKFIQDTATHFSLPDGVSESYFVRTSDAIKILAKSFKNKTKECFFSQLVSFMLKNEQLSIIYDRMTDTKNGRKDNERKKDKARLDTQFRQEWGYAFELTKEILKEYKLAFTNINPFKSKEFTFISAENSPKKPHLTSKPDKYLDKNIQRAEKIKKTSDEVIVDDSSLKEYMAEMRREIIKELHKELKLIIREEIKKELQSGIKNFAFDNFNETLYKDL